MRTHSLVLFGSFLWIGCGSSSSSNPAPGPESDAAADQSSEAAPDAPPDTETDAEVDASPDALPDAPSEGGGDAGPPSGELLLQDGTSDRVVPHVAARSDGTTYLSWYALDNGNYSIFLQRMDTSGAKLWAAEGVLASSTESGSWVMDYDLVTDAQGNAILVYSNTTDFTLRAQRFNPDGTPAWGAEGTALSGTGDDTDAFTPHVVRCSDGALVAVWDESRTSGTDSTSHVVAQRFDGSGQPSWAVPFSVDPGPESPQFSQVVAGGDGDIFVSWVENGGVNYPGDAYVQRVDAQGEAVWAAKKKLNGTEQLAFPMKPLLVADGQGGLFAAWTALVGMAGFQGRIQHIDANGDVAWDAQGLLVSEDATMMQLPSALMYAPGSSRLVVGWKRTDANQSTSGLHVQAFDGQGTRLWDEPGLALVPAEMTDGALAADLRPTSDGAAMFFAKGPVNGMELTAHVAAIPLQASPSPSVADLSSTPSAKSNPAVSGLVGGGYWLVWEDSRGGHPVIYGSWWPSP